MMTSDDSLDIGRSCCDVMPPPPAVEPGRLDRVHAVEPGEPAKVEG